MSRVLLKIRDRFMQDTNTLIKIKIDNLISDIDDPNHSRSEIKIRLQSLRDLFEELE